MQTITHTLRIEGYRGEGASGDASALVAGMTTTLVVRAVDANGTAAPPAGLDNVAAWRFVLAEDWNSETEVPYRTAEVTYDAEHATWTIQLDGTHTATMAAALGANSDIMIGCELVGLDSSLSWSHPAYVLQWTAPLLNRRDSAAADQDVPSRTAALVAAATALKDSLTEIGTDATVSTGDIQSRLAALFDAISAFATSASNA